MNKAFAKHLIYNLKQSQYSIVGESSENNLVDELNSVGFLKTGLYFAPFQSTTQTRTIDSNTTWSMQLRGVIKPESLHSSFNLLDILKSDSSLTLKRVFNSNSDFQTIKKLQSKCLLIGKFTEQIQNENSVSQMDKLLLIPSVLTEQKLLNPIQETWTNYSQFDLNNSKFTMFGDRFFKTKNLSKEEYYK